MAKSKNILVAAHTLLVGTGPDRAGLEGGEELTRAKAKALGLDAETVAGLVERGALIEVKARLADETAADDGAALKAAEARADKAEKALKEALAENVRLKADLEAATAPKA